jgi:DNA-binding winged helix-turn-helix (wHTH) protein/tetratricopeptide (TPR) repeat protein
VRTYVGRAGELARVAELLDRETLFLVYGVGGIGKSELVYKAIEDARHTPRWRSAEPLLVPARAGLTVEHVLAQLRLALDLARPAELSRAAGPQLEDDLAEIARALEARPTLLFVDDVHHLDLERAAYVLGYLSRHVRESRIFAASRIEVPLPPDTPTPVVLRLAPLDAEATARMVTELARRLGIEGPDAAEVFARSGGSPFFVQRLLAGDAGQVESSLERSLRELAPRLRDLLLLVAVLRSRIGREELAAAQPGVPADAPADVPTPLGGRVDGWVRELGRRFLIDIGRDAVMMHDLVRDALVRQAGAGDLHAAHARAAGLYERRYQADPARHAMDALEAVHHLLRAGAANRAWAFAESSYPSVAAAGLDHLLIDLLTAMRDALEEQRLGIDLLRARILLRRSLVAEAAAILASMTPAADARAAFRHAMLAGEVAQRQGRLDDAEALFGRAGQAAESSAEEFQAALQRGYVLALRGRNQHARDVVDAALARLPAASARDRGRHDWLFAVSFILEERFEEGVETAARARAALAGSGAEDLVLMLAMLEVLGRTECFEARTARRLFDEILSRAVEAGRLRAPVVAFYRGAVLYAEGDMRGARAALESSMGHLRAHTDHMLAVIAAYYLTRALVAQGEVAEAVRVTAHMNDVARAAGLDTLVINSIAVQADALLAAGRLREARAAAESTLQNPRAQSNSRWLAHMVLMRCLALQGDVAGARRMHAQALPGAASERYRLAAALERATIELLGGDPEQAVGPAMQAWQGYAAQGQRWLEASAAVALSAALVARGRATDLAAVDEPLARAETLARDSGYPLVRTASALVRAALLVRAGERPAAMGLLMDTARAIGATGAAPEVALVRAGLEEGAGVVPGLRMLVQRLGLAAGPRYRIADRAGLRLGSEQEVEQQRQLRALVVEPARAVITASGESEAGRPLTCELLARLVEAQGQVVTAEALFRDVWGGREYHPLRHRNTVYVAVKRLRQTLRKLLGPRSIIETAAGGWRMADDIDAVSIRPIDGGPGNDT